MVRAADGSIEVIKGPNESSHSHAPNREESTADKITTGIKRKAEEHPEQRPAQLLRNELQGVSPGVLSQMPEQPAIVRTIRRVRRRNMPANPKSLADIDVIPDLYQKTLVGEQFLLYDSEVHGQQRADDDSDSDDNLGDDDDDDAGQAAAQQPRRVLVFATRRNIEKNDE